MPSIAAAIPPIGLFDHSWDSDAGVESSWQTTTGEAVSGDESRHVNLDRPFRTLKMSGLALARPDAGVFLNQARHATGGRFYVPIFNDQTFTTAAALSSDTVLYCDTANRRFFVGYKALIVTYDQNRKASAVAVATILGIAADSLTLDTAPGFAVPQGSAVYPACECDVVLETSAAVATDTHLTFDLTWRERVGPTALPTLQTPDTIPDGETSYQGVPVLAIAHNWEKTETGEIRKAIVSSIGLDQVIEVFGTTSLPRGKLTFLQSDRASVFRLLRFFDSRAGGAYTFWLPSQTADLLLVQAVSTTVWRVAKSIALQDILDRRFLAFWGSDGSCQIRRVVSVTDGGNGWNVTVDTAVTFSGTVVLDRISYASLAKFDSDAIKESWTTDGVAAITLGMVSVQANSCNNGEVGDNDCDTFPDVPTVTTGEPPEDPWEPEDCETAGETVPMFYDSTRAINQWKEPIRGGDLTLPAQVGVTLSTGWVQDNNFVGVGTLSDELLTALRKTHVLDFKGTMTGSSSGTSRNPYHIRIQGSNAGNAAWTMPDSPTFVPVTRKWYQKLHEYTVGANTYTLDVRLVFEYAATGDGAYGTLAYVIAFSNEVNASYVEGSPYAPYSNAPFFRTDPVAWGAKYGYPESKKLCHPQCVALSFVPTSMHSPVGYGWVPPDQERFRYCLAQSNGAPWSAGVLGNAIRNSVFGVEYDFGCMTLGGWSQSTLFPWMACENAQGNGMTACKPTNAGWNEQVGDLDLLGGTDCEIDWCDAGNAAINGCAGHPDEPLEGIGGTHECWRSNAASDYLCVPTASVGVLTIGEVCKTITTNYGMWNGSECPVESEHCSTAMTETVFNLPVYDYTYNYGGNQALRELVFKVFKDDPDYVRGGWTWSDLTDFQAAWTAVSGSWNLTDYGSGPQAQCTAVAGGSPAAYLEFYPPSYPSTWYFEDGSVAGEFRDNTNEMGVVLCSFDSGSGPNGYYLTIKRSTGKATIYLAVNGTFSVLAQATLPMTGDRRFVASRQGSTLTLELLDGAGAVESMIEADDCTHNSAQGRCGLVVFGAAATEAFRDLAVTDANWRKLTAQAAIDALSRINANSLPALCKLYGMCDEDSPAECPSEGHCPCTHISQTIVADYDGGTATYPGDISISPYGAGSRDMACTDPDPCTNFGYSCGGCPGPFRNLAFAISSCDDPDNPTTNPFANGFETWIVSHIVCI